VGRVEEVFKVIVVVRVNGAEVRKYLS